MISPASANENMVLLGPQTRSPPTRAGHLCPPAEPPAVRGVRFRIPSLHAEPRRDEARPPRESGSLAQAAQHSGQGCILCNLRRDPRCWRSKAVYALLWRPVTQQAPPPPAGRPVRCRRVNTQTVNGRPGLKFGITYSRHGTSRTRRLSKHQRRARAPELFPERSRQLD